MTLTKYFAGFVTVALCSLQAGRAEDAPRSARYSMVEDVVYGNKDGMGLTLDVLTPETNPKNIGVILVSSGGWKSSKSNVSEQNKQRHKEHWVQGLLQGGYTIFITRHGSAPRYFVPEMIEDIRRSVRFVRMNAERFHVDGGRLGITSGSSGGHLALAVATTGDDGRTESSDPVERVGSRVQAVVAWFPPTDFVNWGVPQGFRGIEERRPGFFQTIFGQVTDAETQLKAISPIYHVSKDDPPLLLIHGDKDTTVPIQQSQLLKEKYDETDLPVQLIVQPGGGHTYWPTIMDQYPAVWAWFDRYLGPR
ncbi:MAG: prolyl oligopeptidase family serine peptidase [Planctomycetia bacterium]|nr:prolyl oligopeptidase family serine peptidase [Planctomycetia bacterium]